MPKENDALTENLQDLSMKTKEKHANEPELEISREMRRSQGENDLLKGLGERLTPEGSKHVASICVHIYKDNNSDDAIFYTQSNDLRAVPEVYARQAIGELTLHVMSKFGHRPPRKRGEAKEIYKDESSIILP